MHIVGRDNIVSIIGKLSSLVHCAVSELSEGCAISGLSVGLPPQDCTFYELKAH